MKTAIATIFLAIYATLSAGAPSTQDPQPAKPGEEHRWLQRLVGEWKFSSHVGPGQDPEMKASGVEAFTALGGLWFVGAGKVDMGGQSFSSRMTLGYDLAEKQFVGTWIDTMQTHMYLYRGTLDKAKNQLTLEAEGPSFTEPGKTASFRDVIAFTDDDHRTLTSYMQAKDGTWTEFMRADYERVPGTGK